MKNNIFIQLIIPILNPNESFLSDLLPRLHGQSLQPQILLINSGSFIPDGDYKLVNILKKDFNHANTRNIALNYPADFYLFMTQDTLPVDSYLIENLLKTFDEPDIVVTYARQCPYPDANAIEVYARETNYPLHSRIKSKSDLPELGIKTFFCSDSCAMYRGSYFRTVGGFAKDLNTNEDMEFAARAILCEKKIAYCAEAKVYHSHNFSMKQVWNRYRQFGKFFAQNDWILYTVAQYNKLTSTGIRQAIDELKYLLRTSPLSIPKSILLSFIKYIALKSNF